MSYTENDILMHVGPRALEAGRVYQRQRRVTSFENHGDGAMTATVQGNERRPYRQDISVTRRATGQIVIESDCSCPVGQNCKHVAAALLEGLARTSAPFARRNASVSFLWPRRRRLLRPRQNCLRNSPPGSIRWKKLAHATRKTIPWASRSALFTCRRQKPMGWRPEARTQGHVDAAA
jgi:uncharacterized Zn finger protein